LAVFFLCKRQARVELAKEGDSARLHNILETFTAGSVSDEEIGFSTEFADSIRFRTAESRIIRLHPAGLVAITAAASMELAKTGTRTWQFPAGIERALLSC
jgi:hypothetical protein